MKDAHNRVNKYKKMVEEEEHFFEEVVDSGTAMQIMLPSKDGLVSARIRKD